MKLSVVIVNYNVRHFLEQALLSVRKAVARLDAEVWVVDNNSADDSVAMVKDKFPEVLLIANTENTGFAVANNQAIRQCAGEYVLLLNPDTVVEEDTFEKCVHFMDAHPDAGALGVRMIDGSGKFLPESKRGFPSPWTAFCKTFGLSRIFPKSKVFNHYHLGYLDELQTHEVEVLAGAFMLMRRSALDKSGLLDEAFFMYGEDIDLSYRILLAGYKNYYFPETSIIHYKGESTKKGSLNYVRVFYQAMIIFARKHFTGRRAVLFVLMLQAAIWFRAAITLISNLARRVYLPLLDAALIFGGLFVLKNFWASYYHQDPGYYDSSFLYVNAPLYTALWLAGVYFSGGYEEQGNLRRLIRGLFIGTLFIAAVYGFLDMAYRSSRVLILLGAAWSVTGMVTLRTALHFSKYGNLNVGKERRRQVVIVGSLEESRRVLRLLQQAQAPVHCIGMVSPETKFEPADFLGPVAKLQDIALIYRIDEIIFCAADVPSQEIMRQMTKLGPQFAYKIVPEDSLSIIGSQSKNAPGELYTIEVRFDIAQGLHRRNKRLLDLAIAGLLLLTLPLHLLFVRNCTGLIANILQVILGKKSWVGYASGADAGHTLPALRPGVLSPLDALPRAKSRQALRPEDAATIQRLNMLYAKDYRAEHDLEIVLKGYRGLGG
jgi:GT2 family glycosyltransferase